MISPKDVAAMLAETYWQRPANEAELIAMAGEILRDSAWVSAQASSTDNVYFSIEPAHYDGLMRKEAER
jgi:hypothetical protein